MLTHFKSVNSVRRSQLTVPIVFIGAGDNAVFSVPVFEVAYQLNVEEDREKLKLTRETTAERKYKRSRASERRSK